MSQVCGPSHTCVLHCVLVVRAAPRCAVCPPSPLACLGQCLRTSLQALACPALPIDAALSASQSGLVVLLSLFTSHLP